MNPSELHKVFSRPGRPHRPVFSVYLNVDESLPNNLNRGFETQLKGMMGFIRGRIYDPSELERFTHGAHRIADFVSAYQPCAPGLAPNH
jgi:hypothetical protein